MLLQIDRNKILGPAVFVVTALAVAYFMWLLQPASSRDTAMRIFEVRDGEGFRTITRNLQGGGYIRSRWAFELFAIGTGSARELKAGKYELSPSYSTPRIVGILRAGMHDEVSIRIPEGASTYLIDEMLSGVGVIKEGSMVEFMSSHGSLEGKLFPDTYRFFRGEPVEDVVRLLVDTFDAKTTSLWKPGESDEIKRNDIILASLVEKEVADPKDRKIVAGILKKRLAIRMPLQVDATVCYAKELSRKGTGPCYPLSPLDLEVDSPYNTYRYAGLPPGPIGNPSSDALVAAREASDSPYWFYLSDPVSKKTVFSVTLDEHTRNRVKYLSR